MTFDRLLELTKNPNNATKNEVIEFIKKINKLEVNFAGALVLHILFKNLIGNPENSSSDTNEILNSSDGQEMADKFGHFFLSKNSKKLL